MTARSDDPQVEACRSLAARVIRGWLETALDLTAPEARRAEARGFLGGSAELQLWCLLAGVDAAAIVVQVESVLALEARPAPAGTLDVVWGGGELLPPRAQRRRPMAAGEARVGPIDEADEGASVGL